MQASPFLAVLALVALQLPAAPLMVRYASPLLAAAYSSLELVAAALVAHMMYKVQACIVCNTMFRLQGMHHWSRLQWWPA